MPYYSLLFRLPSLYLLLPKIDTLMCVISPKMESRIISVPEDTLEDHLAHGDVECEFEIEVNPENICININGVAFRQEGEATCDSMSPTESDFVKASADDTEASAGRSGKNMAIAIGYGAQASVGNGSNNTAIAIGYEAKASAGNGSNNTARADGIGTTACAGLLGYSNTTATASTDGATAVAGAVADDAGCVLSDLAPQVSTKLVTQASGGSISNDVECTEVSASADAEGATAVAAGVNIRNSNLGNITNIIEAGESGSCSVEATANVDYATAVAAGINIRNSNVGGDFTNHVVADAITASATALRSTAAAGGITVQDSDVSGDFTNDVVADTFSATTTGGDDSKAVTGSVLSAINMREPLYSANLSIFIGPGVVQTINDDDTIFATITPNTGYRIVDVVVDGVSQGPIGSYTFDNVTDDHTVSATFAIDTTPPVITLNGNATVMLEVGVDSYTELGATVTDNDPAYSGSVTIGGDTVNTSTIGTYVVTYNAPADAAGNTPIQVSRTVQVVDTTPPVITLNGNATVMLEVGVDSYTELGATVKDNDPAYSDSVTIGGDTVNTSTIGTYVVTYNAPADAAGNTPIQVSRTVQVVDTTAPVITLNGNATVMLEVGVDSYTELGATVTDNDPAYSDSVTIGGDTVNTSTIGTYVVTYNAPADAAGNTPIQVSRTVQVVDTTAPVITLIGEATLTLIQGEMYVEAGATVTDNSGEALSVSIAGSVDSSTAGTYIVTYDASDSSGNAAAQVTRTVIVGTAQAASVYLPAVRR